MLYLVILRPYSLNWFGPAGGITFKSSSPVTLFNVTKKEFNATLPWKMHVITGCEDERGAIITYVSTYVMQGQSIKAN